MKVFAAPLDSAHCYQRGAGPAYFGWGTIRRYGFGAFQPPGYVFFASMWDSALRGCRAFARASSSTGMAGTRVSLKGH